MKYTEIKNYGKIIKKYFQFLCKYGFSRKQYDNGIDYEVIYTRPGCEIGVFCGLGIDPKLLAVHEKTRMDDKDLMDASHFDAYIVINKDGNKFNLLNSNLFDSLLMEDLKANILDCKSDVNKILEKYSEFLKINLNKLF
ncbi:unknown [Corallococcus sp. CAG:1435]|nr:unknown [Corallococcus sp. CAG:1435]